MRQGTQRYNQLDYLSSASTAMAGVKKQHKPRKGSSIAIGVPDENSFANESELVSAYASMIHGRQLVSPNAKYLACPSPNRQTSKNSDRGSSRRRNSRRKHQVPILIPDDEQQNLKMISTPDLRHGSKRRKNSPNALRGSSNASKNGEQPAFETL